MDHRQAEIEAIRSQIQALRHERDALTNQEIQPENNSPEAIAAAYRHQARIAAEVSAEVQGIDNAIAALQAQLDQKQQQRHWRTNHRNQSRRVFCSRSRLHQKHRRP